MGAKSRKKVLADVGVGNRENPKGRVLIEKASG